jgi:membrane-associated phospholipid phosphatase
MPVLDQNQNQTIGVAASAEGRFRPRFNTDLFPMLAASAGGMVVPLPPPPAALGPNPQPGQKYPLFHPNWDAELRACMYLDEFLSKTANWRTRYTTTATSGALMPPQNMDQPALNGQVMQILQLALEREDRFAEVIDQDDGDGAINYWLGMLKVDPARHPATYLMLRIGRRIGEHVVMCLKGDFLSPRPPQLCPSIVPMIDPPVTPSFPAGHAVQAYLNSYLLAYSLPRLPQQQNPLPNVPQYPAQQASGPLFDLAERVSQNRIVAGIHYPVDIDAGVAVAIECFKDLQKIPSIWGTPATVPPVNGLRQAVQAEFPQYA